MGLRLLRTWITEGCNASCPHCMNKTAREAAQMPLSRFEQMCAYFKEQGLTMISLMGGEPTIHPAFKEIMCLAQEYFTTVMLFTNGLRTDELAKITPRSEDSIIYNFLFSHDWHKSVLLLDKDGNRIIDVVIDHTTNIEKLKDSLDEFILRCGKGFEIQLVINNSINIFIHRKKIAQNVLGVYNYLVSEYPEIQTIFQCGAPVCFTQGLKLPPFTPRTICPDESILVDGNFNIRFCNIHTQKLVPLFCGSTPIHFQIVRNHIRLQSLRNQQTCLEKICKHCILYPNNCNGKCYIAQDCISTRDIINNSDLIWIKSLNI